MLRVLIFFLKVTERYKMNNKTNKNFLDTYKNNLWLNIANTLIVISAFVAMIIFLIIGFIYLADGWGSDITIIEGTDESNPVYMNQWAFLFLLPICALAALAGVISVVASNNKAPITLLVLSSIATIYKFSYAVVQITSGQESVNSSVLIGQPIMFFMLFVQVYFWIKWNKVTDEGKFITEVFSGKRNYIAFSLLILIFIFQFILSFSINGFHNFFNVMIDVFGAMLYTIASTLMAFGNILCFFFFLLSDISWLYWTIIDINNNQSIIMEIFAWTTLIEVCAYTGLAFTGFFQWFKDDFKIEGFKIVRKRSIEKNTSEEKELINV